MNALYAPFLPAIEGCGEVLLCDGPDDTFPAVLDGLLCQRQASQLGLHFWEEQKVRQGEVWRIGQVGDRLHPLRHQEVHHSGGGVDWGTIPVEPPLLRNHYGSLLLENFQEYGQGSPDVGGIDSFALRHEIYVDDALHVKKTSTICFVLEV